MNEIAAISDKRVFFAQARSSDSAPQLKIDLQSGGRKDKVELRGFSAHVTDGLVQHLLATYDTESHMLDLNKYVNVDVGPETDRLRKHLVPNKQQIEKALSDSKSGKTKWVDLISRLPETKYQDFLGSMDKSPPLKEAYERLRLELQRKAAKTTTLTGDAIDRFFLVSYQGGEGLVRLVRDMQTLGFGEETTLPRPRVEGKIRKIPIRQRSQPEDRGNWSCLAQMTVWEVKLRENVRH